MAPSVQKPVLINGMHTPGSLLLVRVNPSTRADLQPGLIACGYTYGVPYCPLDTTCHDLPDIPKGVLPIRAVWLPPYYG